MTDPNDQFEQDMRGWLVFAAAARDRADAHVLRLNLLGVLGYHAASDTWVGGTRCHPLDPELQASATRLARAGRLPEFDVWFPSAEDEPAQASRLADQERLREQIARTFDLDKSLLPTPDYGGTVGSLIGIPIPAGQDLGELKRRWLKAYGRNTNGPHHWLPLVDPRGMVQARPPWWRRWFRRD